MTVLRNHYLVVATLLICQPLFCHSQDDFCLRFKDEYDAFCDNILLRGHKTLQDLCKPYRQLCLQAPEASQLGGVDSPCRQFRDQYQQFCVNGEPSTEPLVIDACRRFIRDCLTPGPAGTTTPQPFNNADYFKKVLPMLEIAGVPAATKGQFSSCLSGCDQGNRPCIFVCECQHYAPIMASYCGHSRRVLSDEDNCANWHRKCGIQPKPTERSSFDYSKNLTYLYSGPWAHGHEFYRNSKRTSIDWVNGRAGGVEKLRIPAVGFGIDLNEWDINFPSVASFFPGGGGFAIPFTGGKRKRR